MDNINVTREQLLTMTHEELEQLYNQLAAKLYTVSRRLAELSGEAGRDEQPVTFCD